MLRCDDSVSFMLFCGTHFPSYLYVHYGKTFVLQQNRLLPLRHIHILIACTSSVRSSCPRLLSRGVIPCDVYVDGRKKLLWEATFEFAFL
jgi:hypothetical protein